MLQMRNFCQFSAKVVICLLTVLTITIFFPKLTDAQIATAK